MGGSSKNQQLYFALLMAVMPLYTRVEGGALMRLE